VFECLGHVALAGATALGWLGAGSVVLRPLGSTGDSALDILNRLGVGAVFFGLATFAAGWLGLLYAAAYVPLLALAAGIGAVILLRSLRGLRRPRASAWPRWQRALAALVAVYVLVELVVTCAPISSADALYYHATAPELYEQRHGIVETPWSWHTYQPFLTEMLVLDGFLLWDSVQGAFAPLLLGLASAAVVALVAHRLAGRSIAVLATAVYVAQPFALWLNSSTFVEPAAAFACALAVANLVWFLRTSDTRALVLAGVFTGALAGVKYSAAGAAAVLAVFAAISIGRALTVRRALAFALPALAVALPWYVKNAILTGDPAYPLLGGWPNDEARAAAQDSFDNYGHGRSPIDLALLPFRLLADAEAFDRAEFMSPLFLLFAPVALLGAHRRRWVAIALAGVATFVVAWFFGVQGARYLFPALPVLAVLAAFGIAEFAARSRVGRFVTLGVVAGALALGAGISTVYASRLLPVVAGAESEDEFLRQNVSYHEGVEWLNRSLPPGARVVIDHVFLLHVDRPALTWSSDALSTTAGPVETRAFFRRYRLTHAVIFSTNGRRRRQLGYVGARAIARVTVHRVVSRTLSEIGPAESMVVYRGRKYP
jgi:hypothetical protein